MLEETFNKYDNPMRKELKHVPAAEYCKQEYNFRSMTWLYCKTL